MAASRREARERALELLYEAELKGIAPSAVLAELPLAPDPFSELLVRGVDTMRQELDDLIAARLREDWSIDRLALIDRLVLRLGLWELRHHLDTPRSVVLSEAVELAKRYGGAESARFVNGVLAGS